MTATTDVVISEKSMLEFFRSDFSGIAVSRMSTMRIVFYLLRPDHSLRPHPEERSEGPRLEGSAASPGMWPILRDARLRRAPEDEVARHPQSNPVDPGRPH